MSRSGVLAATSLALALAGSPLVTTHAQDSAAEAEVVDPSLCQIEPRPIEFFQQLTGTPTGEDWEAASPVTASMPEGNPPDEATLAAITATARELVACLNAGDFLRVNAPYTDEFLLRNFGPDDIATLSATLVPVEES